MYEYYLSPTKKIHLVNMDFETTVCGVEITGKWKPVEELRHRRSLPQADSDFEVCLYCDEWRQILSNLYSPLKKSKYSKWGR